MNLTICEKVRTITPGQLCPFLSPCNHNLFTPQWPCMLSGKNFKVLFSAYFSKKTKTLRIQLTDIMERKQVFYVERWGTSLCFPLCFLTPSPLFIQIHPSLMCLTSQKLHFSILAIFKKWHRGDIGYSWLGSVWALCPDTLGSLMITCPRTCQRF